MVQGEGEIGCGVHSFKGQGDKGSGGDACVKEGFFFIIIVIFNGILL